MTSLKNLTISEKKAKTEVEEFQANAAKNVKKFNEKIDEEEAFREKRRAARAAQKQGNGNDGWVEVQGEKPAPQPVQKQAAPKLKTDHGPVYAEPAQQVPAQMVETGRVGPVYADDNKKIADINANAAAQVQKFNTGVDSRVTAHEQTIKKENSGNEVPQSDPNNFKISGGKEVKITDTSITCVDKDGNGYTAKINNGELKYNAVQNGKVTNLTGDSDLFALRELNHLAIGANPNSPLSEAAIRGGEPSGITQFPDGRVILTGAIYSARYTSNEEVKKSMSQKVDKMKAQNGYKDDPFAEMDARAAAAFKNMDMGFGM